MGKKKQAKKKEKRAKEQNASRKSNAFPAEIAGVKVPDSLRQVGAQVRELAKDPIVSELAAAGLLAAASALSQTKTARKAKDEAADAASEAAGDVSAAGESVKQTLIGIARDVLDAVESANKDKKPAA